MKNTFSVQVNQNGSIALPKKLLAENRIREGETLNLFDLGDGVFVMSARRSRVDAIANQLAQEWRDSGETLESMLAELRIVRDSSER
ncbi:MAG: AbrB/MazE/SpoVT family DNA-binding domain-containing protein [Chloroflexi bacterium]|nr:AbrB/MazE/SpoVT family DNA-binding domain-containing protein [Chloroflexota bacterium]